jgi:hypothetical protein
MWTPDIVQDRIASRSLLPDSMFVALDADALLDLRDDSFEGDWVRAAEAVQSAWESYPAASRATPEIDAARAAAFERTYYASGGHHELAATVSDDFELICRRALLGIEIPFVYSLEQAYEAQQIPH